MVLEESGRLILASLAAAGCCAAQKRQRPRVGSGHGGHIGAAEQFEFDNAFEGQIMFDWRGQGGFIGNAEFDCIIRIGQCAGNGNGRCAGVGMKNIRAGRAIRRGHGIAQYPDGSNGVFHFPVQRDPDIGHVYRAGFVGFGLEINRCASGFAIWTAGTPKTDPAAGIGRAAQQGRGRTHGNTTNCRAWYQHLRF